MDPAFESAFMPRIYLIHLHSFPDAFQTPFSALHSPGKPTRLARGGRIEANVDPLISANHVSGTYRTNMSDFAEWHLLRGLITSHKLVKMGVAPLNG
jgi:hypothetical protein